MMENIIILRTAILRQMMKDSWKLENIYLSNFQKNPVEVYTCDSKIKICQADNKWNIGIDENYLTLGDLGINRIYFLVLLYLYVIPSSKNKTRYQGKIKLIKLLAHFY